MARDMQQYLQQPDKLFRRLRDEHGNLVLSKAARAAGDEYLAKLHIQQAQNKQAQLMQAQAKKAQAGTSQSGIFKKTDYTTMTEREQLEFMLNRFDYFLTQYTGRDIGKYQNIRTQYTALLLPNADKTDILNAIADLDNIIHTLFPVHLKKDILTDFDAYTSGRQMQEITNHNDKSFAAMIGMTPAEARPYMKAVEGFTFQWDFEIRSYQTGVPFTSRHSHTMSEIQKKAENLEKFIQRAPAWHGGDTYRGISISPSDLAVYHPGYIFDMRGSSSWSIYIGVAQSFAAPTQKQKNVKPEAVVFICKQKQPKGTSINGLSHYRNEHEIITSKDARWRVISVTQTASHEWEIECEPV